MGRSANGRGWLRQLAGSLSLNNVVTTLERNPGQMQATYPSYAIGLDVGATKIAGGIVDLTGGTVIQRQRVPTLPHRGGQTVLEDALSVANALMHQAHRDQCNIAGIGIGVPELVDLRGNITSENAIAWRGVPLQEIFSRLAPAVVESDVRAAALAEAHFGAGRAFANLLYVTVGSGISSSLVLSGKPYAGAHGNALVLGSSPLTTTCTECGTVLEPILEEFASGLALTKRFQLARPDSSASGEAVFEAAAAGDSAAIEILCSAGEALGTSVGFAINILDPEAVIVGGGLGMAGGLYWSHFVRSCRAHVWSEAGRDLPIIMAALGADAGIIGAAALILVQG